MDKLRYTSTERYVEGVIVGFTSGSVAIDLKGRLGHMSIPMRMLITDSEPQLGLEVGFLMSYPEVLGPEINEKYANNLEYKKNNEEK